MTQRYEVQTKFTYGWENVWHDEDDKLIYFDTRKQAMKELRENVDDWNNDPNTTSKYYYSDYRVKPTSQTNTSHNPQANQPQAQAMTTMNPQAQAIACLQITNAYPSTPQAQKNSQDG